MYVCILISILSIVFNRDKQTDDRLSCVVDVDSVNGKIVLESDLDTALLAASRTNARTDTMMEQPHGQTFFPLTLIIIQPQPNQQTFFFYYYGFSMYSLRYEIIEIRSLKTLKCLRATIPLCEMQKKLKTV